MRDPDLVLRAQQAAAVLERAWDHWRTLYRPGSRSIETGMRLGRCSVAAQLLPGSPCPVSLVSAYFVAGLG